MVDCFGGLHGYRERQGLVLLSDPLVIHLASSGEKPPAQVAHPRARYPWRLMLSALSESFGVMGDARQVALDATQRRDLCSRRAPLPLADYLACLNLPPRVPTGPLAVLAGRWAHGDSSSEGCERGRWEGGGGPGYARGLREEHGGHGPGLHVRGVQGGQGRSVEEEEDGDDDDGF
jgi:hypothetical protein